MEELGETAVEAGRELADVLMASDRKTDLALKFRRELGIGIGASLVGAGLGAVLGFFFSKKRLETKYQQICEQEIAEMREHYNAKKRSLDAQAQKYSLDLETTAAKHEVTDIIQDNEYSPPATSSQPPMAIQPPQAVVDAAVEEAEPEVRNIFREDYVDDNWDYNKEKAKRSPVRPYVIHYDEREDKPYIEVTYTYYEGDDVICDERDEVVDERERLIGVQNLDRFGHGSNDSKVVYIRNDKLELQFEIIKSPNSYSEEVAGITHSGGSQNLERMRRRERRHFDDEQPSSS